MVILGLKADYRLSSNCLATSVGFRGIPPLEALDPRLIASASRSDDATGRNMLKAVTRSFGPDPNSVEPVLPDWAVHPEPRSPAEQIVSG